MAKMLYEHVLASGGFSGESFDIAQGPANTGIIDVLLSAGVASALTDNAPHVLVSTGALTNANALDISGMEVEAAGAGGVALRGRFFYLSVQNTDIATNNITVTSSATINGLASLVIDHVADYLFHHVSAGVWRVNALPTPGQNFASIVRVPFTTTDWVSNVLTITQGTHGLAAYDSYIIQIINTDLSPVENVDVEMQFAGSGNITLRKAPRAADFNGIAIIAGTID